ncbi:MAG: ctpA [Parcubacteria group bacterium]|nr:ctpA [Parcubacteria group bacterium]
MPPYMEDSNEEQHLFNEESASSGTNASRMRSWRFGRTLKFSVVCAVVLVVGFVGGLTVGAAGGGQKVLANIPLIGDGLDATPNSSLDFSDFWKVYNVLQSRFVQTHASSTPATAQSEMYAAIQGLVTAYGDPYTVFFPPEQAKLFQDNIAGNFSGVGMEIGENSSGALTVIAPLRGTPADKAGILAGDSLLAIDGKKTDGLSTDEAVKLIRGPKGSTVTFTIGRGGTTKDIKVVRDTIQVPTIDHKYDAKTGVYTIALYEFTANSAQLFDGAFADFQKSGSTKLIVDLRGNPGGYLDSAVRMASHFLPDGSTVVTEDYKGNQPNLVHKSTGPNDLPKGTKVVVLMDQGSASASEIFSGALQDNKAATLIGTRSFGKGSVQELVNIGKASLKVTVARWLTPSGRSISDGGLTPDIKVERTQDDVTAGKDPQMSRAVQFLTTGK